MIDEALELAAGDLDGVRDKIAAMASAGAGSGSR